MSDTPTPRMVSVRRCQYENPNLPKYIVPYEDAAQLEHELIQCKRELAEAREELIEWRTLRSWGGTPQIVDDFIKGQQTRIHAAQDAEKQRDTLAEALEMIITHNLLDNQCDNGYPPRYVAKKALAAVKGGDA